MAIEVITTKFVAETQGYDQYDQSLKDIAKSAGVAEDEIEKVNKRAKEQASAFETVRRELGAATKEARKLEEALKNATDPAEQKKLQSEIEKSTTKIKGLRQELNKLSKSDSSGVKKVTKNFSLLGSVVGGNLISGAISGIGSSLLSSGKKAVRAAGDYEQTRVAFETFLGSTQKANEALERLNSFSISTPFTPGQVVQAGKALLAFGIPLDSLESSLQRIGDIAAGTGKDFNELAVIYGKARVQGTLFAEDINQLTEAGVPIIDEFAKILGVTNAEVKKLASEGKIGFAELETAFTNLTSEGGRFFELTAKQSQTLNGRISTLVGKFEELQRKGGEGLAPAIGKVVEFLIEVIDRIDELGPAVNQAIEPIDNMITEFEILAENLGLVGGEVDEVGATFDILSTILKVINTQNEILLEAFTAIISAFNKSITAGKALINVFNVVVDTVREVIDSFSSFDPDLFLQKIKNAFTGTFELDEANRQLRSEIDDLGKVITESEVVDIQAFSNRISSKIISGMKAGVIDATRATELSNLLRDRITDLTKDATKEDIETTIPINPKVPEDKTQTAVSNELKNAFKVIEQAQAEAETALKKSLEDAKKFAAQQVEDLNRLLGLQLDKSNEIFETGLNKALQSQLDAYAQAQQLFDSGAIDQGEYLLRIQQAETDFQTERLKLQADYLQSAKDINDQVLADVKATIAELESKDSLTDQEFAQLRAFKEERDRLREADIQAERSASENRIAIAQGEADRKIQIAQGEAEKREQIEQAAQSAISSVLSALSGVYEVQKQRELDAAGENAAKREAIERKFANRQNLINIGQAISSQALGVVKAFATNPLLGALLAAGVLASTAPYIAAMRAQKFKDGTRFVDDPNAPAGRDTIPAWLDRGERVTDRATNARHWGDLNAIEAGAFKPGEVAAFSKLSPEARKMALSGGYPYLKSKPLQQRKGSYAGVNLSRQTIKALAREIANQNDRKEKDRRFQRRE